MFGRPLNQANNAMPFRLSAIYMIASFGLAAFCFLVFGTSVSAVVATTIALSAVGFVVSLPRNSHSQSIGPEIPVENAEPYDEPAILPKDHTDTGEPSGEGKSQIDEIIRLKESAYRDPLTGLLNRASFRQEVERCLLEEENTGSRWLMFVDLDGFKEINDQNGHDCGDKVLKTCARRLQLSSRMLTRSATQDDNQSVFISRFGGDEFVVFIDADIDASSVERLVKRMLKVLSGEITHGNRLVALTASIGIAQCPSHGRTFDKLIKAADSAMYVAKANSSPGFVFYDDQLDQHTRKIAKLETELHSAIAQEQLEFVFQPIFDLRTSEMVSAEALVRWNHPDGEVLRPAQFFNVLERTHLVGAFNEWGVAKIIESASELRRRNLRLMITANVAPQQLASLEFISLIKTHLHRSGCPPELLQIEVTEDAAMREPALTAQNLHKLHDIGVTLAIDDFGVGYSNLARLTELPLSRLKIDRSLLTAMDKKPSAFVLMQSIINLSNSLGFHSVVEGIETDEQLAMVSAMGADLGQGFLLSNPITFEQLVALIEAKALMNQSALPPADRRVEPAAAH